MAEIKTINYIPLADTTARENITTINENITTINENISQLSDSIANQTSGTGWTTEQINLLDSIGNFIPFTSADGGTLWDNLINSLKGSSSGGEDEPDEPVNPEVTLTAISVTYGGGDVAVGTALTDLTGITVTAVYSDGTSKTVTDYTLSGEIVEGSNTVTVYYSGKTATFTVTGIAESGGDDVETNGWTNGEAYPFTWAVTDYALDTTTGEPTTAYSGGKVTDFIPCLNASILEVVTVGSSAVYNLATYDKDKKFISSSLVDLGTFVDDEGTTYHYVIPEGVAYVRYTCRSIGRDITSVTPIKYPPIGETTQWTDGQIYEFEETTLKDLNTSTGVITDGGTWYTTNYIMCYGASKVIFSATTRKGVVFYDSDKNYISGTTINNTTEFAVPEGACYVVGSGVDMNNQLIKISA